MNMIGNMPFFFVMSGYCTDFFNETGLIPTRKWDFSSYLQYSVSWLEELLYNLLYDD